MIAGSGGEPVGIGDALERVLGSMGAPPPDLLATVFAHWEEVVGAEVARHCRPVAVHRDRLEVVASDPVWASEVQWLGTEVLARINQLSGSDRLKSVTVRVAPTAD